MPREFGSNCKFVHWLCSCASGMFLNDGVTKTSCGKEKRAALYCSSCLHLTTTVAANGKVFFNDH